MRVGAIAGGRNGVMPVQERGLISGRTLTPVSIGAVKVTSRATDVLVAQGIGSSIALCLRDPVARLSGMAYIVLPQQPPTGGNEALLDGVAGTFADRAVPHLIARMEREGASVACLKAAVVGAAQVLAAPGQIEIGKGNTLAVLNALKGYGVRLDAHDIGGSCGRVCRFFASDGRLIVRAIGSDERELAVLGGARSEAG